MFSAKMIKLWRARSLLYRSRFLQPNTHFLAFFDTLQIQILAKISETFSFSNFFSESPSGHDRRWRTWWTRAGGRMEPIVPCTHGENWPSDLLWVLPPGHGVWWVRSSLVSPLSILPSCQSTLEVHPRPHSQVSSSFWKPLTWIIIRQYSSLWALFFCAHCAASVFQCTIPCANRETCFFMVPFIPEKMLDTVSSLDPSRFSLPQESYQFLLFVGFCSLFFYLPGLIQFYHVDLCKRHEMPFPFIFQLDGMPVKFTVKIS